MIWMPALNVVRDGSKLVLRVVNVNSSPESATINIFRFRANEPHRCRPSARFIAEFSQHRASSFWIRACEHWLAAQF